MAMATGEGSEPSSTKPSGALTAGWAIIRGPVPRCASTAPRTATYPSRTIVTEQPVDGRRLQSCRGGDGARGDRVAALSVEQVDGCVDDPLPDLLPARGRLPRPGGSGPGLA